MKSGLYICIGYVAAARGRPGRSPDSLGDGGVSCPAESTPSCGLLEGFRLVLCLLPSLFLAEGKRVGTFNTATPLTPGYRRDRA